MLPGSWFHSSRCSPSGSSSAASITEVRVGAALSAAAATAMAAGATVSVSRRRFRALGLCFLRVRQVPGGLDLAWLNSVRRWRIGLRCSVVRLVDPTRLFLLVGVVGRHRSQARYRFLPCRWRSLRPEFRVVCVQFFDDWFENVVVVKRPRVGRVVRIVWCGHDSSCCLLCPRYRFLPVLWGSWRCFGRKVRQAMTDFCG